MDYTHLTQDERYQIAILLKAGHLQSDIARLMNRNPATISRELRRNRGQRGYRRFVTDPEALSEFTVDPVLIEALGHLGRTVDNTLASSLRDLLDARKPSVT